MSSLPLLQRRRQRREKAQSTAQARLRRGLLSGGLLFSFLIAALLLMAGLGYAQVSADLPSPQLLPALQTELLTPTRLVDSSGLHTLAEAHESPLPRALVNLESLPAYLPALQLAALDPGYWQSPSPALAQRLARELLLWREAPGPRREMRAFLLGGQIISQFGRKAALQIFLNSANFGHFATGLEDAAQTYFGKPASTLSPLEAALLAVSAADPTQNPFDAPQSSLKKAQALLASLQPPLPAPSDLPPLRPINPAPAQAPAFSALALQEAAAQPGGARLLRGGAILSSSLDYDLYQQAQQFFANLQAQEEGGAASRWSAALFDPRSGQTLALMGDRSPAGESPRLENHRPGLSLLPFLYLTGFSRGLSPASLMWDVPASPATLSAQEWQTYQGPLRARLALQQNRLSPAQALLNSLSLPTFSQTLQAFDLPLDPGSDLEAWLNAPQNSLSPLQLARAYGILAAEGVQVRAASTFGLSAVSLSGEPLLEPGLASASPVVSPALAYLVNHVLGADRLEGPGQFSFPAAFESASTPDGQETWGIGYTPQVVALVWSNTAQAPALAARLLSLAAQRYPSPGWQAPPEILHLTVCDPSGMLPTPACPALVEEVFLSGYEPTHPDTLYRLAKIDRETGLLATVFTDPALVEERAFLLPAPEGQAWAQARGLEALPEVYDTLMPPPTLADVKITSPQMFAAAREKVLVRGLAAGEGFVSYRLEAGQGLYPQRWVLLAESETAVKSEGPLGTWEVSGLEGVVVLRLTVIYASGEVKSAAVVVEAGK